MNLIRWAIDRLSPEHIAALTKMFTPHIMAQLGPLTQTSLSGLRSSQAQRGIFDSKYGATQETGLRANANANAAQQAFAQAMNLAGSQANAFLQHPAIQMQPNYNMAQGIQQGARMGLLGYALAKGQGGSQAPSPYEVYGNDMGSLGMLNKLPYA